MSDTGFDYRLDGYRPADAETADAFNALSQQDDAFVSLAAHHGAKARDSWIVLFDGAAIWGPPGQAEYLALHLVRDHQQRNFRIDVARHPVIPLAQRWLIARGCPSDALAVTSGPVPRDPLTQQIEDRLRMSGDRYEVLLHHTDNPGRRDQGVQVRTLVHDHHPDSAALPYRLFIEDIAANLDTYIVREGAFASLDDADQWFTHGEVPFPQAPSTKLARTAVSRSQPGTTSAFAPDNPPPVSAPAPHSPPRPRSSR